MHSDIKIQTEKLEINSMFHTQSNYLYFYKSITTFWCLILNYAKYDLVIKVQWQIVFLHFWTFLMVSFVFITAIMLFIIQTLNSSWNIICRQNLPNVKNFAWTDKQE